MNAAEHPQHHGHNWVAEPFDPNSRTPADNEPANHVCGKVNAEIDPGPRDGQPQHGEDKPQKSRRAVQKKACCNGREQGAVIAGKRAVRNVRNQLSAKADGEGPRVINRQRDKLRNPQSEKTGKRRFNGCAPVLGVAPKPTRQQCERNKPYRIVGKEHCDMGDRRRGIDASVQGRESSLVQGIHVDGCLQSDRGTAPGTGAWKRRAPSRTSAAMQSAAPA